MYIYYKINPKDSCRFVSIFFGLGLDFFKTHFRSKHVLLKNSR